jgi:hypothetical protein
MRDSYISFFFMKLTEGRGEVKVKLSLCLSKHHAMKTNSGSEGIAPRILDLGTIWRWVVSFTPQPLYPQGKSPRCPLDRRLGGPQSRSRRGDEEKNSQAAPVCNLSTDHMDVPDEAGYLSVWEVSSLIIDRQVSSGCTLTEASEDSSRPGWAEG